MLSSPPWAGFIAARAVLGAAESIGTPAQVKTAATYFAPAQRSIMIGIGNMAPNIGAVVTPLLIPPLALAFGWRFAFILAGGLGLVWVVLWLLFRPPPAIAATSEARPRVSIAEMLRDRRQWAIIFGQGVQRPGLVVPAVLHARFLPPPVRPESGHPRPTGGPGLRDGGHGGAKRRDPAVAADRARRIGQQGAQGLDAALRAC